MLDSFYEIEKTVHNAAQMFGFRVFGVYLIGSFAHDYENEQSDLDIKVISARPVLDYISIARRSLTTPYTTMMQTSSGERTANISFVDITSLGSDLCSGRAQNFYSWITSQVVVRHTPQLQELLSLAHATYTQSPKTSELILARNAAFYRSISSNMYASAMDTSKEIDKRIQRVYGSIINGCYYVMSRNAQSYLQKKPLSLVGALESIVTHYKTEVRLTQKDVSLVKESLTLRSQMTPEQKSELLDQLLDIAEQLLDVPNKAFSKSLITGDVELFNKCIRTLLA